MSDRPRERDERRKFKYSVPTFDDMKKRADDKGGMFDSIFKDGIKQFLPKEGDHLIRILPAPEEAQYPKGHYGIEAWTHRNIGPGRGQTYLCLKNNPSSPHDSCPICDELYRLGRKVTKEEEAALKPYRRMIFYVIDRDHEDEGVLAWVTSGYNDSEIATQSIERRGSWINIIDPDEGYDVEFTRVGTTMTNTKYRGFRVVRESSPLSDREKEMKSWLNFIQDNPLPDVLNFVSPEKIENAFRGKAVKGEDDDDDQPQRARDRRSNGHDEEEERPLRRTRQDEGEVEEKSKSSRDDGDDERPARRSRSVDDSDKEPQRRARPRDEEEEKPKTRRPRDDDDDNDQPRRSRAEKEDDDELPARTRSRLAKELDDDIPSEGGRRARGNGRDDDDMTRAVAREEIEEAVNKPRSNVKEPEQEEDRPRRRRASLDEDAETEDKSKRRASSDDDEKEEESASDRNARVRERLRGRVNREDDC